MVSLEDVPNLGDNAYYVRKAHLLVSLLNEPRTVDKLLAEFRYETNLDKVVSTNVLAYASVHGMVDYDPADGLWKRKESSKSLGG